MSRKIVIIPTFSSSHLLKCWIPNMIQAIDPDIIIINEGLFPEGPENKGHIDETFKKKWCHCDYWTHKDSKHLIDISNVGFDWNDTIDIVKSCQELYPDRILLVYPFRYKTSSVNECFVQAISTFHDFEPELEDIIFPLEPDAFLLETDKDLIKEEISRLKPGEGLKCLWRDFLETQYYCEAINEVSPKVRRFCYCFDNIENYKKAMDGFMSQSYPNLQYTDKFWIRHYPWFVHNKWKELRYELIWRKDPKYWQDFEEGLQKIRKNSTTIALMEEESIDVGGYCKASILFNRVLLRPSRTDEGRWAQFVNVVHPKAVKSHPNFVK